VQTLTITKPDDWHVHFRDEDLLPYTVNATATHFMRALVMPNLKPALTSIESLINYRTRIMNALPKNSDFTPYCTFYLTETLTTDELEKAKHMDFILGAKLYPAGATTHSEAGVQAIKNLYPILECMQALDKVLQIHAEVTSGDIFAREALFLEQEVKPIVKAFPKLRIVVEHISTKEAVEFVQNAGDKVAATITPHHLKYNRNHLLAHGIHPHYYCLPILKKATHQEALIRAAISGNPQFFAGTDSAPHAKSQKESACGCAGIFSAPYALALYAEVFDEENQLEKLENFVSRFGAEFYQLPLNQKTITLGKTEQTIPSSLPFGKESVVPIAAGENIRWSVIS
jgi:dihydroorotase